jgi:hypothetical protein
MTTWRRRPLEVVQEEVTELTFEIVRLYEERNGIYCSLYRATAEAMSGTSGFARAGAD